MIGIFKTNIATRRDSLEMLTAIRRQFQVGSCNVDLDDCDKVLRIVDMNVSEDTMIDFVRRSGFDCELLD